MNDERKMILEMVSKGEVSVDEGEKLLNALNESEESLAVSELKSGVKAKRIVIAVERDGKKTVNLRVPVALIKSALKLGKAGMAFSTQWGEKDVDAEKVMAFIDEIDMDEIMDGLNDGDTTLPYTIIDAYDDENQHVTIILE